MATPRGRAFRGLFVPLALSLTSFVGLLLTAISLGLAEEWTAWQFSGLYGVADAASGLASIVLPNIWHLPVTEVETSRMTRTKLAVSAVFLPHWGALTILL